MAISFTEQYAARCGDMMKRERVQKALKHFGYDKPEGYASATRHNKEPFKNIGFVISNLGIDTTLKTRIVIDYDPNFEHCLIQFKQS